MLGTVQSHPELGLKPESGLVLARAGLSLEVLLVPMTSRIVLGGASGTGLETNSCCSPTYTLVVSMVVSMTPRDNDDEDRCGAESL